MPGVSIGKSKEALRRIFNFDGKAGALKGPDFLAKQSDYTGIKGQRLKELYDEDKTLTLFYNDRKAKKKFQRKTQTNLPLSIVHVDIINAQLYDSPRYPYCLVAVDTFSR